MLSGPFLSKFVFLRSEHHSTYRTLRCAKSTQRVHHLSVVYGDKHRGRHGSHGSLAFASGQGYLETVTFLVTRRGADVRTMNDYALRFAF